MVLLGANIVAADITRLLVPTTSPERRMVLVR
jgi:hypothetical protein